MNANANARAKSAEINKTARNKRLLVEFPSTSYAGRTAQISYTVNKRNLRKQIFNKSVKAAKQKKAAEITAKRRKTVLLKKLKEEFKRLQNENKTRNTLKAMHPEEFSEPIDCQNGHCSQYALTQQDGANTRPHMPYNWEKNRDPFGTKSRPYTPYNGESKFKKLRP